MVVVLNRLCDLCAEVADAYEVTISPLTGVREVDLCPSHAASIIAPLVEVLESHGSKVRTASKTSKVSAASSPSEPVPCLWCKEVSSSKDQHLLHLRDAHGLPSLSLQTAYGVTCPECGIEAKSLGVHLNRAHGRHGTWEPFHDKALRRTDPYGVVKAVTELGERQWSSSRSARRKS